MKCPKCKKQRAEKDIYTSYNLDKLCSYCISDLFYCEKFEKLKAQLNQKERK